MTELAVIKKHYEAILRRLDEIKPRPSWVTAAEIMELTGADKHRLETWRKNGTIEFKQNGAGYLYDLNSLNQLLLKVKK